MVKRKIRGIPGGHVGIGEGSLNWVSIGKGLLVFVTFLIEEDKVRKFPILSFPKITFFSFANLEFAKITIGI